MPALAIHHSAALVQDARHRLQAPCRSPSRPKCPVVQLGSDTAERCTRVAQPADLSQYGALSGIVFDVNAVISEPTAICNVADPLAVAALVP